MTKDDILRDFNKRFPGLYTRNGWNTVAEMEGFICNALDEARKDKAIRFQKFVSGFFIKHGNDRYIKTLDAVYENRQREYSTEHLYEQFKQQAK